MLGMHVHATPSLTTQMDKTGASKIDEDKICDALTLGKKGVCSVSSEGAITIGVRGPDDAREVSGTHRPE